MLTEKKPIAYKINKSSFSGEKKRYSIFTEKWKKKQFD